MANQEYYVGELDMFIILSQKIDTESSYNGDKLFEVYHYPGRYRNQIHTGDTFVYYQGNRFDRSQRYYFGTGRVGKIKEADSDNYYAELLDVTKFENKVPIYLPEGGYIEQLGYDTVRKSINPPRQSSVRPLSEEAYKFILQKSGNKKTIAELNAELKKSIQGYFMAQDKEALLDIINIARQVYEII